MAENFYQEHLAKLSFQIKVIIFLGLLMYSSLYAYGQSCDCPASSTCNDCSAGLTSLTLRFDGSAASLITASDQSGVVFTNTVNPEETFTFSGSLSNEKFTGSNIELTVNNVLDTLIGTACNANVFVGNAYGSFTVVAGQSKNGGSICCSIGGIETVSPVIKNCPTNMTVYLSGSSCSATVNWTAPTATDNCTIESFTSTHISGGMFLSGSTSVVYTAKDVYENTQTCTFTVTVIDNTDPIILDCPSNIIASADTSCQGIVSWTAPTTTDNCSVSLTSDYDSGSTFPLGTTKVTYSATDDSGNTTSCSFDVIINDTESPVITGCPADIIVSTNTSCEAIVSWTAPMTADNCWVELSSSHHSGNTFPLGTTVVTYTATDSSLNKTTCTFNVIVNISDAPEVIACPSDISVYANDQEEAIVTWKDPEGSVLCGGLVVTKSHEPGSTFFIGTTSVVYDFKDGSGNTSTCTFNVLVLEQEAQLNISKAITPDGDGINDSWQIENIENFSNNTVVVVDRWGNRIFYATGYDNQRIFWNGTNNNGSTVPIGTYFYTIEVRIKDEVVIKKGFLEVIW
jgi:gliding motility-associated-like protein